MQVVIISNETMQKYENNLNLLSEFIDYLKFKIDNKRLTLREAESLRKMFFDNLTLTGTAEDIACFYHRTPQDVRNVVHRKMLAKPERRVHYSFSEFQNIVPSKWKEKSG